jgi:hypothetical protein
MATDDGIEMKECTQCHFHHSQDGNMAEVVWDGNDPHKEYYCNRCWYYLTDAARDNYRYSTLFAQAIQEPSKEHLMELVAAADKIRVNVVVCADGCHRPLTAIEPVFCTPCVREREATAQMEERALDERFRAEWHEIEQEHLRSENSDEGDISCGGCGEMTPMTSPSEFCVLRGRIVYYCQLCA